MPYKEPTRTGHKGAHDGRNSADAQDARFHERYPWAAFLAGAWTRVRPTKPGWYAIATRAGHFVGFREYVGTPLRDASAGPNEPGWQGSFWSEPAPEPPKKPEVWKEFFETTLPNTTDEEP